MSISFSYQNSDCFSTCFSSYFVPILFSFLFVNTCTSTVCSVWARRNLWYVTICWCTEYIQHIITPLKVCDIEFFAIRIAEGNVVIDTQKKKKENLWFEIRCLLREGFVSYRYIYTQIYEYSSHKTNNNLVLFHIIYTSVIYVTHICVTQLTHSGEKQSIFFVKLNTLLIFDRQAFLSIYTIQMIHLFKMKMKK